MGFEVHERRTPAVHAEIVPDSDVPPGCVQLSTGLALALTCHWTGTARIDVRPEARRGPPSTPEEKLLKAIFGQIDHAVVVAEPGPIHRGRRLLETPADGSVTFDEADHGLVGERRDLPRPDGTERVEVDVGWEHAAEFGDHVVDARGTTLRIVGFVRPDGETAVEPWPSAPIEVAVAGPPPHLARSIDTLEVSVRTMVFLDRLGPKTLVDLVGLTEVEILKSGAGRKILKELKEVLADLGLSFGMAVRRVAGAEWVVEPPPTEAPRAAWSAGPLVSPLSLVTPTVRARAIARAIGPYDRLTQRPITGVAVPLAQGDALRAAGGVWLFAELVRRSDDDIGRVELYEQLLKGERRDIAPGATRAHEVLDTVLAVFGYGMATGPDGFRLEQTALGTSTPRAETPRPESTDGTFGLFTTRPVRAVRRGPTTASWSYGEVRSAATVDDDGKPIPGGLLCERIFGPVRDYACACGRYERMKHRGVVCEVCGVEVASSRLRAERMGHIVLRSSGSRGWQVLPVLPPDLRGDTTPAYAAVIAGGDTEPLLDAVGGLLQAVLGGSWRKVDYAAETVAIVDPGLPDDGIAGPRSLLAEILRPWIYGELESRGYCTTIKSAKKLVDNDGPLARRVVDAFALERPVWLGAGERVAGARIVAVDGGAALRLSRELAGALGVVTGDRVAVHVPLSDEAAAEVAKLRPGTVRTADGWLGALTHTTRVAETLARWAQTAPIDGESRAARWLTIG